MMKHKKSIGDYDTTDVPTTPVMMDNPTDMQRVSYVFESGNWLVKGDMVNPGAPHALNADARHAPKNRLGLAMWLTQQKKSTNCKNDGEPFMGATFWNGPGRNIGRPGTQGIPPTHRELLDYLFISL